MIIIQIPIFSTFNSLYLLNNKVSENILITFAVQFELDKYN